MTDYEETYNSFFKAIVENPDGTLNRDQVMRELADYAEILDEVSRVYCHITNSCISKPNTLAREVIAVYEDVLNELVEEEVKDRLLDLGIDTITGD